MDEKEFSIIELIKSNNDLETLNKELLNQNLVDKIYSDRSKFLTLIQKVWGMSEYSVKEGNPPLFNNSFIGNEITYFIHGLIHDNPLIKLNEKFKEEVRNKLEGYYVVCEDNFTEWIPNAISFSEIDKLNLKPTFHSFIRDIIKFTYLKCFKKTPSILIEASNIETIDQFIEFKRNLFKQYFFEPFGMNSLFYLENSGTIDNPKEEPPTFIKRIILETNETIRHVNEGNLNEIHIVVGCAHERPLEYLLKNQHILEKYDNIK